MKHRADNTTGHGRRTRDVTRILATAVAVLSVTVAVTGVIYLAAASLTGREPLAPALTILALALTDLAASGAWVALRTIDRIAGRRTGATPQTRSESIGSTRRAATGLRNNREEGA